MKIDVKKIAKLSNLEISENEEEFDKQLGEVLDYIDKLNKIDTSNVKPTAQVTGLINITRNDNFTHDMFSQDEALSGTNKTHNGLFKVDKLLESED